MLSETNFKISSISVARRTMHTNLSDHCNDPRALHRAENFLRRRRTIITSTNIPLKYEAIQWNREQLKMETVRIYQPNIPSHFSEWSHATGSIRDSAGKGFHSKLVYFQQTWEECQITLFYTTSAFVNPAGVFSFSVFCSSIKRLFVSIVCMLAPNLFSCILKNGKN